MINHRRTCQSVRAHAGAFERLVCLAVLTASAVLGQNTNAGEIRGTVTDPSGAVVPGAQVVILNTQTGITSTLATNNSGIYDALSLIPGSYTLSFAAQGFTTVKRAVTLEAQVITVDARLTVGAAASEVVVTAESPLLQTEGPEVNQTLTSQVVDALPHVGQSWLNYTSSLPGVTGTGAAVSVNGTEKYEGNWLSDGGNIVLPRSNNLDQVDNLETIAEIQVTTSSFNAQYGSGTAVFSQITKSGTNQFHGAAYEYLQNDALNARSFFAQQVAHQRRNQFGGALGGPVLRDKLFFYANYDTVPSSSGTQGFSTYPTAAARQGDFSDPVYRTIYDPTSLTTINGQQVRQAFPGNKIPQSLLDPVALKIQSFLPLPNLPGVANNYYFSGVNRAFPFTLFGKVDYSISSRNRLSASGSWRRSITTPDALSSPTFPISTNTSNSQGYQAQITDVFIVNPSIVNEYRAAFIRQAIFNVPQALGQGYISKLGVNYALADLFPSVSISGPVGGTSIGPGTSATLGGNTFTQSDTVTITRGRHIMKIGGQFEANQDNGGNWGDINAAQFSFSGAFTSRAPFDGQSGLGYADFLTGQVASWSASVSPVVGLRMKDGQAFVQDDIKLRPNLTVNLGFRYELQGGWSEVENRLAEFDPTVQNPITKTAGAIWFAGDNGRNSLQKPVSSFLPRVGAAWSPGKWSFRTGFGVYTHRWGTDVYAAPAARNTTGFFTTGSLSDTTQVNPVFKLSSSNPSLNTYYPHPGARTPGSLNGQPVAYYPYETPASRTYSWSFDVQRELAQGLVADVAYVGNHGTNLYFPRDLNQLPLGKLGQGQTARPYPQYQGIAANLFDGISNYDALQASIRKRFSRGLTMNANYTWSKNLVDFDAAGWAGQAGSAPYQNAYDPASNYGLSNNDVPQAFKLVGTYELPVGRGRSFLKSSNPIVDTVFGGWQVSGIFITQSGYPFTPVMGSGSSGALAGSWYPNRVGSGSLANPTLAHWFDTSAFVQPSALTFGNSGRNILRGPHQTTLDFSMGKNVPLRFIHEGSQLQFRADATNVLNHPVFGNPNASIGNAAAGTITSTVVGGRTIQLGARLSF